MPNTSIRKSWATVQASEEHHGQAVPTRQLLPKRLPATQDSAHIVPQKTPDTHERIYFLRLPEVKAMTGLSKTSLYELIRAKDFPAPIRLAPRAVAWSQLEVQRWAEERILASRLNSGHYVGKRTVQHVPSQTRDELKKFA